MESPVLRTPLNNVFDWLPVPFLRRTINIWSLLIHWVPSPASIWSITSKTIVFFLSLVLMASTLLQAQGSLLRVRHPSGSPFCSHFSSQIRQVLQLSCAESTTSHPLSPLSPTVQETSIEEDKPHTSSSPLSYSLSFPFIRAYVCFDSVFDLF